MHCKPWYWDRPERSPHVVAKEGTPVSVNTETLMARNIRSHVMMLDCCEICGLVTEQWDIYALRNHAVLLCRNCQNKFSAVLRPFVPKNENH